jgi:hypothetical protein
MHIIDIRSNSDKNILNENINCGTENRIVMHQKSLMLIRIPLFPELSSDFRPRGGGKHIRERTAKWPFIERPLHFDFVVS